MTDSILFLAFATIFGLICAAIGFALGYELTARGAEDWIRDSMRSGQMRWTQDEPDDTDAAGA